MAAASALRQADRLEDAEVWYRHAATLRPHEARSHTNLGAILHLNGKYKQAAAAYSEALRLQPGDATTIMNLHKLAATLAWPRHETAANTQQRNKCVYDTIPGKTLYRLAVFPDPTSPRSSSRYSFISVDRHANVAGRKPPGTLTRYRLVSPAMVCKE